MSARWPVRYCRLTPERPGWGKRPSQLHAGDRYPIVRHARGGCGGSMRPMPIRHATQNRRSDGVCEMGAMGVVDRPIFPSLPATQAWAYRRTRPFSKYVETIHLTHLTHLAP